jgi:divalent metal cation (Fe/Co/Zn/Cd) transporter
LVGGVASFYQGFRHLLAPERVSSPALSVGVLVLAAVFESSSLSVGLREYKRVVRGRNVHLWTFIHLSKDPSLYASLLEDSAALIGISIAALGVLGATVFRLTWADGAASIAIGMLLTAVAAVLANETRSLIAGEAVAPPVMAEIRRLATADARVDTIFEIATLHLGPQSILVALTLSFKADLTVGNLNQAIRELTAAMRQADERIRYLYVRPPPDRS